jgi:aldehyde:ferredoxin oxidoreductase
MPRSFHNKILRVNLTDGKILVEEPGAIYYRRYMGGWNIIADVLIKEVPADADPLGPENKLVMAPGILAGLPLSGASRGAVGAKSPLTGAFGAAEAGGDFPAQFKRAGYDAIIVEGQAPHPVYIWIKDGAVEIRDASQVWGKTIKDTEKIVRDELGEPRAAFAMIGPGGENLVRFACVMHGLKDAAGRTGMGAVMGSKNLKAVVALGTQQLEAVDMETIRDIARTMAQSINAGEVGGSMHKYGTGVGIDGSSLSGNLPIRNFRDGIFPNASNLSADVFMEQIGIGMEACYACAMRCKKVVQTGAPYHVDPAYGGPEYESFGALGSACGVDDIEAVSKANELCNAHSMDTIGTGVTIAFAMECFENELLSIEDTGGIELRFGNGEALVKMVDMIGRREGLGDLLAEGTKRAAEKIGGESLQFAVVAKGQEYPMHEPRFKRGLAIGYAVSPTGADHCHSLHDTGLVNADEEGFTLNGGLRAMGILEPMLLESLDLDKVRATAYNSIRSIVGNCICICMFLPYSMADKLKLINAATGWNMGEFELVKVGERALNLARVFNVRAGFGPEDDTLAPRSFTPTLDGPLSETFIDPDKHKTAIHNFYAVMGWDPATGIPTVGKLAELGVSWAVDYLPS